MANAVGSLTGWNNVQDTQTKIFESQQDDVTRKKSTAATTQTDRVTVDPGAQLLAARAEFKGAQRDLRPELRNPLGQRYEQFQQLVDQQDAKARADWEAGGKVGPPPTPMERSSAWAGFVQQWSNAGLNQPNLKGDPQLTRLFNSSTAYVNSAYDVAKGGGQIPPE